MITISRTQSARLVGFVIVVLIALITRPSLAVVVTNHGGPILGASGHPFTIAPLYVGTWSGSTDPAVVDQQEFVQNVADYISRKYGPSSVPTFLAQYGVVAGASVAAPQFVAESPRAICDSDIRSTIATAQANGLASFGPNTLIVVFFSSGFSPGSTCSDNPSLAYHRSEALNKYYGVVMVDINLEVPGGFSLETAHEVFESATDPDIFLNPAWDNLGPPNVEICDNVPANVVFSYNGSVFPGCYDNSLSGNSTTTGYDPPTAFEPLSFRYPLMYPLN